MLCIYTACIDEESKKCGSVTMKVDVEASVHPVDDSVATKQDVHVDINVLSNDLGTKLASTAHVTRHPTSGSTSVLRNGVIMYIPNVRCTPSIHSTMLQLNTGLVSPHI